MEGQTMQWPLKRKIKGQTITYKTLRRKLKMDKYQPTQIGTAYPSRAPGFNIDFKGSVLLHWTQPFSPLKAKKKLKKINHSQDENLIEKM